MNEVLKALPVFSLSPHLDGTKGGIGRIIGTAFINLTLSWLTPQSNQQKTHILIQQFLGTVVSRTTASASARRKVFPSSVQWDQAGTGSSSPGSGSSAFLDGLSPGPMEPYVITWLLLLVVQQVKCQL